MLRAASLPCPYSPPSHVGDADAGVESLLDESGEGGGSDILRSKLEAVLREAMSSFQTAVAKARGSDSESRGRLSAEYAKMLHRHDPGEDFSNVKAVLAECADLAVCQKLAKQLEIQEKRGHVDDADI